MKNYAHAKLSTWIVGSFCILVGWSRGLQAGSTRFCILSCRIPHVVIAQSHGTHLTGDAFTSWIAEDGLLVSIPPKSWGCIRLLMGGEAH